MNNCKSCGGRLIFSPEDKGNKCERCGKVYSIKYEYSLNKSEYDDSPVVMPHKANDQVRQVKCNSCGANVLLGQHQAQSLCPYCGSSEVVDDVPVGMLNVESIIPFAFNKDNALKRVRENVKNACFANTSVLQHLTSDSINGIYVNTFLFDLDTTSKYHGRMERRVLKKKEDGSTYFDTETFYVRGTMDHAMENISIETNSNLTQAEINQVSPYDYTKAVKYRDEFMAGYMLEYQEKMLDDAFASAKSIIERKVTQLIMLKHGASRVVTLDLDMQFKSRKYNYCLLPVYLIRIKNNEYTHKMLMNGQTGKTTNLPRSGWKIFGLIASILGVVGLVIGGIFLWFLQTLH